MGTIQIIIIVIIPRLRRTRPSENDYTCPSSFYAFSRTSRFVLHLSSFECDLDWQRCASRLKCLLRIISNFFCTPWRVRTCHDWEKRLPSLKLEIITQVAFTSCLTSVQALYILFSRTPVTIYSIDWRFQWWHININNCKYVSLSVHWNIWLKLLVHRIGCNNLIYLSSSFSAMQLS